MNLIGMATFAALIGSAIAFLAQPLQERIDLTIILTGAGFGAFLGLIAGELSRLDTDRAVKVGTLWGGAVGLLFWLAIVTVELLS